MFKAITNSEDLVGKTIKYMNISDGVDCDLNNIIYTESGELMLFNARNGHIKCFSERHIFQKASINDLLAKELINEGIITKEEINDFKARIKRENEAKEEVREQEKKEQRYQQYLHLKKEFELPKCDCTECHINKTNKNICCFWCDNRDNCDSDDVCNDLKCKEIKEKEFRGE